MEFYALQLVLFFMLFTRVSTMLAVAPFFGSQVVPVPVKLALSLFMAFVLYPVVAAAQPTVDLRLIPLALLATKEAAMGLLLGFSAGIIFSGVRSAGEMIGFDLGWSISNVIDPENGRSNPIVGEFFFIVLTLVFLLVNGHHFLLQSLIISYEAVPMGGMALSGELANKLISLSGIVFIIAIKLAAPVIVTGFLINLTMGVLARVSPQMNVFVLSFPIKITAGLIVMMTSAPVVIYVFKNMLTSFEDNLLDLVRVM